MPDYPTTAVPFLDMPLPDLRDPVVTGPGAGGLTAAAESYRQLGDLLKSASEDLRVARPRPGRRTGEPVRSWPSSI